jgi:hypothetical protein
MVAPPDARKPRVAFTGPGPFGGCPPERNRSPDARKPRVAFTGEPAPCSSGLLFGLTFAPVRLPLAGPASVAPLPARKRIRHLGSGTALRLPHPKVWHPDDLLPLGRSAPPSEEFGASRIRVFRGRTSRYRCFGIWSTGFPQKRAATRKSLPCNGTSPSLTALTPLVTQRRHRSARSRSTTSTSPARCSRRPVTMAPSTARPTSGTRTARSPAVRRRVTPSPADS